MWNQLLLILFDLILTPFVLEFHWPFEQIIFCVVWKECKRLFSLDSFICFLCLLGLFQIPFFPLSVHFKDNILLCVHLCKCLILLTLLDFMVSCEIQYNFVAWCCNKLVIINFNARWAKHTKIQSRDQTNPYENSNYKNIISEFAANYFMMAFSLIKSTKIPSINAGRQRNFLITKRTKFSCSSGIRLSGNHSNQYFGCLFQFN